MDLPPIVKLFDERYCVCWQCGLLVDTYEGQTRGEPIIKIRPHLMTCELCGTNTIRRMVSRSVRKMIAEVNG